MSSIQNIAIQKSYLPQTLLPGNSVNWNNFPEPLVIQELLFQTQRPRELQLFVIKGHKNGDRAKINAIKYMAKQILYFPQKDCRSLLLRNNLHLFYIYFYWLKSKLLTMVYSAMHNLNLTHLSLLSLPCSLHLQWHRSFISSNTFHFLFPTCVLCKHCSLCLDCSSLAL